MVMDLKRQRLLLSRIRVARAVLGATLLFSILTSSFPLATLASGPMCTLACCAGPSAHVAGSCMNGSCHAFLTGHTKKIHAHHEAPTEKTEELCGLSRLTVNASRIPLIKTLMTDFGSGSYGADSHSTSKKAPDQA